MWLRLCFCFCVFTSPPSLSLCLGGWQLTRMMLQGQISMFYIIQVLQPNSRLWQSTAFTFDTLFSSELCRHPTRDEFGRNQWLLERILLQLATWEELRASWRSSSEGQWCAYRRC